MSTSSPGSINAAQAIRSAADAPPAAVLAEGVSVEQMLVQAGLVGSGKEAKRLIAEGGLRLDNAPVDDPQLTVTAETVGDGIKVSIGKKKHRMLRPA